ncbi:hypothetical protein PYCC9005_001605 [Savitreella phatthalungensis]
MMHTRNDSTASGVSATSVTTGVSSIASSTFNSGATDTAAATAGKDANNTESASTQPISYVQRLRAAKATVWSERGPKDTLAADNNGRLRKGSSSKRSRFGRFFGDSSSNNQSSSSSAYPGGSGHYGSGSHGHHASGSGGGSGAGRYSSAPKQSGKMKLIPLTAAGSNALVPRLSATEAYDDNDQDEFDKFASYPASREALPRRSISPVRPSSIGGYAGMPRVDELQESGSGSGSGAYGDFDFGSDVHIEPYAASSQHTLPGTHPPKRMDSMLSSDASSSMMQSDSDALVGGHRRSHSAARFDFTSSNYPSRSGSPTQIQQYQITGDYPSRSGSTAHLPGQVSGNNHGGAGTRDNDSSDDELEIQMMPRQRLFVANADSPSDSD